MISRAEVFNKAKTTHQECVVEEVKYEELDIELIKKQQLSQVLKEDLIKRNRMNYLRNT